MGVRLLSYRVYFLCLIVVLCSLRANAQKANDLVFEQIRGMTDPSAISIFQDSRGFLWVGSWGGLFRYDGYKFKHYPSISYDSSTISGQGVLAIVEDKYNRLWVACNNGLNCYDRFLDRFYQFHHNSVDKTSLVGDDISCMIIDSKERLWVGTYRNGLCYAHLDLIYNVASQAPIFHRFESTNNSNGLTDNFIQSIFEDKNGFIWIVTGDAKLHRWVEKENRFEHFIFPDYIARKAGFIELWYEDTTTNNFWFTTRGVGIISWNKQTGRINWYTTSQKQKYLSFDLVRHIWKSPNGVFWVGTDGGGLSLLDENMGEIANYKFQTTNPYSISSDAIYRIFRDRSQNIWLATFNGQLTKLNAYRTAFKLFQSQKGIGIGGLNHKSILSFLEDKKGNLWIGTDGGGVNIFNRKTGQFTYLTTESQPSLSSNAVICMSRDDNNDIWMGTYGGGLMCYHTSNGKIDRYIYNPNDSNTIRENNIWTITTDRQQNIWCVTLTGILEYYNPRTRKFIHFDNDPMVPHNYLIAYPTQMHVDSRNWLWITTSQGVTMLDLNKYNFDTLSQKVEFNIFQYIEGKPNTLPGNEIYAMAEDLYGNMWFGTNDGRIFMLDVRRMQFGSPITQPNLENKSIRSMIFDSHNRLWMGTSNGLWLYNPRSRHFIHYDETDGLQGDIFSRAILRLSDGAIVAGGTNGFNLFYPEKVPVNLYPPRVIITEFKIFNQPIKIGEKWNGSVILSQSIEETKEIFLSHNLNYFSFVFTALDYTNPSKNKYAYILEGFDREWQFTSADRREAIYSNLPPGEYVFRVKASNNDGIWSPNPVMVRIHIIPPWWQRWWFKVFAVLLAAFIVWAYIYRKNVLARIRNEELNALVIQKTQELLEKNNMLQQQQEQLEKQANELRKYSEALAETNRQLIEKQKIIMDQAAQLEQSNEQLRLINASKDKFFSIIAHDLRNPFNVLIGLSDIMYRNYDTLPPEKIKRYAEIISLSAKSGYNLLENLLQWSRTQTGSMPFTPVMLQLVTLVEETLDLMTGDAERKNISLSYNIDSGIVVWADESMLLTVFRNLISNAIKFTPEGGSVKLSAKLLDNKMVQISISDTGVGIPQHVIPNLFRIDVSHSTKGTSNEPGTGLGLVLCKEFVEKHGGSIWVESVENKGSTFHFTIPVEPN
ncbi:MAG: ATP-binding protein [Bacteroidales bacterium]|nr:ATP-binding protein [Bacteroidales bacterium]